MSLIIVGMYGPASRFVIGFIVFVIVMVAVFAVAFAGVVVNCAVTPAAVAG